jgi:hypothetical protein
MQVLVEQQRLELVLRHMLKFVPNDCSNVKPQGSRSSLERANHYGLTSLRDSLQFVDLVLTLGPDFDSNLLWAREILEYRSCDLFRPFSQEG